MTRRIALIDDEADVATYLATALEDHGYEVHTRTDTAGLVEFLEELAPDVICLDLVMPGRTGVSLYETLCRHPRLRETPVVIITGLAADEGLRRLLVDPAPTAYLDKPVDLGRLLEVLSSVAPARVEVSR